MKRNNIRELNAIHAPNYWEEKYNNQIKRRLIQLILDDELIGLYYFPNEIKDREIQSLYYKFSESEYDDFEEYLTELYPHMEAERVFVDEINVE